MDKISLFTGKSTNDLNGYPKELLVLLFGDKDDYASCLKCDAAALLSEHPGSVNTKGRAIIRTSLNSKLEARYNGGVFSVPCFIDLQLFTLGVGFFVNGNQYMPKRKDEPIIENKEEDYSLSEIDTVPRVLGQIVDEEKTIPYISALTSNFDRDELILDLSVHCKYYNSDKGSIKAAEIESIVSQYAKRQISYITARTLLLSYYKTASIPEAQYEIMLIDTPPISFYFKTAEELQGIIELGIDNIFRREAPELNAFAKELFYPYANRKGFEILLGNFKVSREHQHPVRERINKLYGG